MKIKLTSVFVDNQEKGLKFYTGVLGFVKKTDISAGNYRWLTVVSPEEPNGPQLLLEPNENPAAQSYQEAIFKQGIPAAMFFVDDLQNEYQRLQNLGVKFTLEPMKTPGWTIVIFDDTCGNFIQITQIDWKGKVEETEAYNRRPSEHFFAWWHYSASIPPHSIICIESLT